MLLDISRLFDIPDSFKDIDCEVDLEHIRRAGHKLFARPVKVTGKAQNRAGIVSIDYTASFELDTVCDKCLEPIQENRQMQFSHILVLSLNREDNDELIVVSGGQLDLAELTTADILLEIPTLMVCREDCKGLCPVCGKNRNVEPCGCSTKTTDPRLDGLRALLDEMEGS